MTRSHDPNPDPPELLPAQGEAYPPELAQVENRLLRARRAKVGDYAETDPVVGLALSGGGIRSATFSLGVLQALASLGLLRRLDLLSTVSGGGYLGSFLGALYVRAPELGKGASPAAFVEATLQDSRSAPVGWLRENGRYLTPAGSGDGLLAGAVVLRNWAALQWLLGIFVLMLVLLMGLARVWLQDVLGLATGSFWASGVVKGMIWWSPYVALPFLLLGLWVVPVGWAYWLVSPPRTWTHQVPPFLTTAGVAAVCVWAIRQDSLMFDLLGPSAIWVPSVLAGLCLLTLCAYGGVSLWALVRIKVPSLLSEDSVLGPRQRLTDLLRLGFALTLVALGLALVDSLGQTLYAFWSHKHYHPAEALTWAQFATVFSPVAALLVFGNRLLAYLPGKGDLPGWIRKLPLNTLALCVALLLGLIFLSLFSFLGHGIAWAWRVPALDPGERIASYLSAGHKPGHALLQVVTPSQQLVWLGWGLGLTGVICLALGHTFEFLNQSALGPFYRSMLTRAYLGASNPKRKGSGTHHVVEGDDLSLEAYAPHAQGGPLHLVNVTLNETYGGSSQVEQKDRHGLGMAVGPGGITVGMRHCATWTVRGRVLKAQGGLDDGYGVYRVRDPRKPILPEALSLGQWVGISGAAVAPGMGSNTCLGFSLLLGFFNVRLGHWWRSGVDATQRHPWKGGALRWLGTLHRRLFPIQFHFLDELLAEFPGTSVQHWYLSDGGHFENTGVYELLRRRVPLIILCDCGADPGGDFGDLTNLVRKARVDLGAEVEVLDQDTLTRLQLGSPFGTLDQVQASLLATPPSPQSAHALLAAVYYDQAPAAGSILVLLKPGLAGDEPLDVLKYREANPHFPQETTADQFFGEAQWESYRRLGEHIGRKAFPALTAQMPWGPLATALKNLPRRS